MPSIATKSGDCTIERRLHEFRLPLQPRHFALRLEQREFSRPELALEGGEKVWLHRVLEAVQLGETLRKFIAKQRDFLQQLLGFRMEFEWFVHYCDTAARYLCSEQDTRNNPLLQRTESGFLQPNKKTNMTAQTFVDIFSAKDRVTRMLRESGAQPYSRILMNSQLPEEVLEKVLELLAKEHKIRMTSPASAQTEATYQHVSGSWSLSGVGA